jgi:hypothetical protein
MRMNVMLTPLVGRNTGKRGRAPGEERESPTALTEQQGFGF